MGAMLLSVFGGLALLLAALGRLRRARLLDLQADA
jgi:hypothetical protein